MVNKQLEEATRLRHPPPSMPVLIGYGERAALLNTEPSSESRERSKTFLVRDTGMTIDIEMEETQMEFAGTLSHETSADESEFERRKGE